jgi:hypothetical protein
MKLRLGVSMTMIVRKLNKELLQVTPSHVQVWNNGCGSSIGAREHLTVLGKINFILYA